MFQPLALPPRDDVPLDARWDQSRLFVDATHWTAALDTLRGQLDLAASLGGALDRSPSDLLRVLQLEEAFWRRMERLLFYAHNDLITDATDPAHPARLQQAEQLAADLQAALAFIDVELLALPAPTLESMLGDPAFDPFRPRLRRLLRRRDHTLSLEGERLLALAEPVANSPQVAFEVLTRTDLKLETVELPDGQQVPVHRGTYLRLLTSRDRDLRARAFHAYHAPYAPLQNTLAALYVGSVHRDMFLARARNFPSSLEASLHEEEIPDGVYHALLDTVRSRIGTLHRYVALRARVLGLERCQAWDLRVPLLEVDVTHSWPEAVDRVIEALDPLGAAYQTRLRDGLFGGWVDHARNRGKRPGGSAGFCYDAGAFIALDFDGGGDALFMLAHEAGHAMHGWLSSRQAPFAAFRSTTFAAEVASTVNELLLSHHLRTRSGDQTLALWALLREIDLVAGNLFTQTRLAEYELRVHERVERGERPDAGDLRGLFLELWGEYLGPAAELDPAAGLDGLTIPHLYRAFYTYTYATGVAAGVVLAQRLLAGEPGAREAYLEFLSSGSAAPALDLLRRAGVDMRTPAPIEGALRWFEERLAELEARLALA